jgi:hypothetical protein
MVMSNLMSIVWGDGKVTEPISDMLFLLQNKLQWMNEVNAFIAEIGGHFQHNVVCCLTSF